MPTFDEPTDKMIAAFEAERARDEHTPRLDDVNIQVLVVYASQDDDGEPRGEALVRDGRPVLAAIRIITLEERSAASAKGLEIVDVRLLLNGDRWGSTSAQMQRAAIDQCLTRIEVQVKDGKTKRDDVGRPKIRTRKWDYEIKGYAEVAERHGRSSLEVHEIRVMLDEHGQAFMPWLNGDPVDRMILAARPKKTKAVEGKAPKSISATGYNRGSLGPKALVERLQHITRPSTILGVAQLELQGKPRAPVIKALKALVFDHRLLNEYTAIENGVDLDVRPDGEKAVKPDLAAAVLVTSPENLDEDILERIVPECADSTVLEWIIDDEGEGEDARDHIVQVVQARIDELDHLQ